MSEIHYLSKEGLENLKKQVDQLKKVERPFISKQIADARDKGDLSENAEYDAAKEAQGLLELKISKLEAVLGNSRVLDTSKMDASKVSILSTVKVLNIKVNKEVSFTIVAENEANLKLGKISLKSPIGAALLGARVGEIVKATIPAGTISFEIKDIFFQ